MPHIQPKTVIVITGPTASGKTDLAIRLAQHFDTAVISADSRQCYREMTIGTAKPPEAELKRIPHYFINSHSVATPVNAGMFEQLGLAYAAEIFQHKNIAILCGGTGLYVQAFCEGIDLMPVIPENIRVQVRRLYQTEGLETLQKIVLQKDPRFYELGEIQNPHRLMRALEVWEATGNSILAYRTHVPKPRGFRILKIGLEWPREALSLRIAERTHRMMAEGLVDEVRSLLPFRHTPPLETVGYREIFRFLDAEITLETAVDQIATHTRQYAKRQMTWFKKDAGTAWFDAGNPDLVLEYVLSKNQ